MQLQKQNIDQGTVIHGVVSLKYDGINCYGVVISASCDIANNKIKKIYYLIAVDIKDWLMSEIGFSCAFNDIISSNVSALKKETDRWELDIELIKRWNMEDVINVAKEEVKGGKEYSQFIKAYHIYNDFYQKSQTVQGRKSIINEKSKTWIGFLKNLEKGIYSQYYYLPEKYYKAENIKGKGLIVDIQELGCIPLNIAREIVTPGIDRCRLKPSDDKSLKDWTEYFWLPNADSFVSVEGTIESPRREHLMQHFSNGFVRIGTERMSDLDYECLMDCFKA